MSIIERLFGPRHNKAGRPPGTLNSVHSNVDRDEEITREYLGGTNSEELAKKHGLSRERICQILRRSNAIEYRSGRKAAAKAAFDEENKRLKEAARVAFNQDIERAIGIVRSGKSIADAAREVNPTLTTFKAAVGRACKARGIASQHGRWRDLEPRKSRCRELRSQGLTWSAINEILISEGLGAASQTWIGNHLPELIHQPRAKSESATVPTPKPPKINPEFDWTDESKARLLQMWFSGVSAQQCADVFGPPCTRNSVIGKINRMRHSGELVPPQR